MLSSCSLLPLAALEPRRLITAALVAVVVPAVLLALQRAAQAETRRKAGERVAAYGVALRIFVGLCWLITGVFVLVGGVDGQFAKVAPLVALFGGLSAVLHLEVFGVLITWDSGYLYTRSAWRAPRIIPLKSVERVDYSAGLQWYRLHTRDHGIVRLHQMKRGIPQLFAALPCATPAYPPTSGRR